MAKRLILGSGSKWRGEVLRKAGYEFMAMSADIDERAIRDADPIRLVLKLADAKADALLARIRRRKQCDTLLITSDQVLQVGKGADAKVLEKPAGALEAFKMMQMYRGSTCSTITSVAVTDLDTKRRLVGIDICEVDIGWIPGERMKAAIRRGDVLGSCGALVTEDPDIAPYITKIHGPRDSIDGLPLFLLRRLLAPFGA